MESLEQIGIKAKKASRYLAKLGIDEKNKALEAVADALIANAESIIAANEKDLVNQVIKKVKKSKTLETIASELEEEEADIKPIYDAVVSSAPDYDINVIKDRLDNM